MHVVHPDCLHQRVTVQIQWQYVRQPPSGETQGEAQNEREQQRETGWLAARPGLETSNSGAHAYADAGGVREKAS